MKRGRRPVQGAFRGTTNTDARRHTAGDIVTRAVADPAVDDLDGSVVPAGFETLSQVVREAHEAHQAAFADDGVVPPRSPCELFRTRGAKIRQLLVRARERDEFVGTQSGGVGNQRRESDAGSLGGGHHADLRRGVGPPAPALRPVRADNGEALALGKAVGDVVRHDLQRMAVQVEGLLAEVIDAGAQVVDGGVGMEVAELPAFGGNAAGDLVQAFAVVGHGAHGRGSGRIAAQCTAVDDPGDDAIGLALGWLGGPETGHRGHRLPWRRNQRATADCWTMTRRSSSQRRSSAVV